MTQAVTVRGHYRPPSPEQVSAVVDAMARGLTLAAACSEAGCSYTTLRSRLERDDELAERVEAAKGRFHSRVINEISRRALDGVERAIFHGGEVCGVETKYSDRLLLRLADLIPDWRQAVEHKHEHTGRVEHEHRRAIDSDILQAMNPAARIDVRRVLLLEESRDKSDTEKQSALLALAQDAARDGVDFDTMALAREMRIGKLADVVDAEFEAIDDDDTAAQLRELEELL